MKKNLIPIYVLGIIGIIGLIVSMIWGKCAILSTMGTWYSGLASAGALIYAYWQIMKEQQRDEIDNKPEIMMSITHLGVYKWYDEGYKDDHGKRISLGKEKNIEHNIKRNTFRIGNYGRLPAYHLSVKLSTNKNISEIEKWLKNGQLLENNNVKKFEQIKNYYDYTVKFQDYLLNSDGEKIIWFPREYKDFFIRLVVNINIKLNLGILDPSFDLSPWNKNLPVFTYKIKYNYLESKLEKELTIIKIKPTLEYYYDSDGDKRIRLRYYIINREDIK